MFQRVRYAPFALFVLLGTLPVSTGRLLAQGTIGALTGVVTDPAGAVIVGAKVVATNNSTNIGLTASTDEAGVYTIPSVPLGGYTVSVQAPGFKRYIRTGVIVEPAQVARVDAGLEVGQANESVSITADAPLLQQETSSIGTEVSQTLINRLPYQMGGRLRDPSMFINLVPGATGSSSSSGGMRLDGSRGYANEMLVDGAPLSCCGSDNVPDYTRPSYDTITEFRVEEAIPPAEFGRTSGGVVLLVSRSGTNGLHGDVIGLFRNNIFDARKYNAASVSPEREAEFGGSLGGPVVIPKVYDGRNKTFFYWNFTGFRSATYTAGQLATVPTPKMRSGDFSEWPQTIYDPSTADASGNRSPFANNLIPASRVSHFATAMNQIFPLPNRTGVANNLLGESYSAVNTDEYYIKFDEQLSDTQRISVSSRSNYNDRPSWGVIPIASYVHDGPDSEFVVAGYTAVLRPNLVNQLQFSVVRAVDLTNDSPSIGLTVPGAFGPATGKPGFPAVTFSGQGISSLGGTRNDTFANTHYDLQEWIAWTRGKHGMKFGFRLDSLDDNELEYSNIAGTYGFSQFETSQPGVSNTGNSYASYLLGLVDNASVYSGTVYGLRSKYLGVYAQDDWKVAKRLTLNYGVRWEMQTPWTEVAGRVSEMDPAAPNPGAGGRLGASIFGGSEQGGTGGKGFAETYLGAIGPRFGVAYQLDSKTVLRAGAGLYYAPLVGYALNQQGFVSNVSVTSQNGGLAPVFVIDNGWPASFVTPPPFINPTVANGQAAYTTQRGSGNSGRLARTSQWQFSLQRYVKSILLEASYVGTVGHGIPNNGLVQVNQLPPGDLQLGSLLTRNITDPLVMAAGYAPPYPGFTGTLAQALRPFPQYSGITTYNSPTGDSTYHALLIKSEKRFSNGLQFLLSYAFSKTISDISFTTSDAAVLPQDQYNLRGEKSLANLDVPHRFVLSYSYELPAGPGKRFLNHGVASRVLGGWSLAVIHTYQSGSVFGVTTPDNLPIFNGTLRPNRVAGVPVGLTSGCSGFQPFNALTGQKGQSYLNRAAFAVPPPYTLGDLGVVLPNVRGCASLDEDASLFKKIIIRESHSIEFRGDLYNSLNRRVLNAPVTDLSNPSFGLITGQGSPRVAQLGIRIEF